ncbi:hypothetical protein [Halobellus inordinatus]|uniref:hypothetical protein n=1 Tax=Halobellus inordinatus TaxID=1126236 RepID=UPI00210C3E43|nr:hypothetical protein [Halobellus inordinatus]
MTDRPIAIPTAPTKDFSAFLEDVEQSHARLEAADEDTKRIVVEYPGTRSELADELCLQYDIGEAVHSEEETIYVVLNPDDKVIQEHLGAGHPLDQDF